MTERSRVVAFQVPAEPLAQALIDFGKQSGFSVTIYPWCIAEMPSVGLSGSYTISEALDRLLDRTGLGYNYLGSSRSIIIERIPKWHDEFCGDPGVGTVAGWPVNCVARSFIRLRPAQPTQHGRE